MIYKPSKPIASIAMKILWIALLILCPVAASAASPEQTYLAARDAQIKKIAAAEKKLGVSSDRFTKLHDGALADLEKQLREIIGPSKPTLPGLVNGPKVNYEALLKNDLGFGMMDGLAYWSEDDKTRVVVTTEGLFKTWLREHRKGWYGREIPQDPAKTLADESFYTQAVNSDATLSKYAELPIKKPSTVSVAYAMLGGWSQDDGPWEPDELVISALQGGKLYVVRAKTGTKLGPFPPCKAVWDEAERKSNEAFQHPKAKGPDSGKLREQGAAAFRRCFAGQAPKDKGFADLVRQAQAMIDGLPVK